MRSITNDYRACKLVKLDASEPGSPLVVMQEGYAPDDPNFRVRMFYLQRDGLWIDEIARSTRPDQECGDIVFETAAEAMQVLTNLSPKPEIRDIPVSAQDVQTYMDRAKSGTSEELFKRFLARYRAAKVKK